MNPSEEGEGILDLVLISTFFSWVVLNLLLLFGLVHVESLALASMFTFLLLAALLGELVLYVYLLGNPIAEAKE